MIHAYHMTKLSFISSWLSIFPNLIICVGAVNILLCVTGILSAATKNNSVLVIFAGLMACSAIVQFFATYATFNVVQDTYDNAFTKPPNLVRTKILK